MAKLSTAIRGFGERVRQAPRVNESSSQDLVDKPQMASNQYERTSPPIIEDKSNESVFSRSQNLHNSEECEVRISILEDENLQLSASISQLKGVIKAHEEEIESLKSENERLRNTAPSTQVTLPDSFDKRLIGIENAVAHGLAHTLNALQSFREGERPDTALSSREDLAKKSMVNGMVDGVTDGMANSKPEISLVGRTSTRKLLEPTPQKVIEPTPEGPVPEIETETEQIIVRSPIKSVDNIEKVHLKSEHHSQNVKSSSKKLEKPKSSKSVRSRKKADDFDDITFFMRPSASTRAFKMRSELNRASKIKPEPQVLVKAEPTENLEPRETDTRVKREVQDENEHVFVKQEPSKRRKALAPLAKKTSNIRTSVKREGKEVDYEKFDFVDKPTLLEQSRDSLQKSRS